jgi:hypothetical protein
MLRFCDCLCMIFFFLSIILVLLWIFNHDAFWYNLINWIHQHNKSVSLLVFQTLFSNLSWRLNWQNSGFWLIQLVNFVLNPRFYVLLLCNQDFRKRYVFHDQDLGLTSAIVVYVTSAAFDRVSLECLGLGCGGDLKSWLQC